MDTHELAWAAGFFDGEGTVTIKTNGGRAPSIALVVAQSGNPVLLERFRLAVGTGAVLGPYSYGTRPRQPIYHLSAYGFEKVQAIIARLWPWLGPIKREQAAVRLIAIRDHPRRTCPADHVRGLDHRGVNICLSCRREARRAQNDRNRVRPYVARPSRRKEGK